MRIAPAVVAVPRILLGTIYYLCDLCCGQERILLLPASFEDKHEPLKSIHSLVQDILIFAS